MKDVGNLYCDKKVPRKEQAERTERGIARAVSRTPRVRAVCSRQERKG